MDKLRPEAGVHVDEPSAAKLPRRHCACTLPPSHAWPDGHSVHVARVAFVPPDVNEPSPQWLQAVAATALYFVSAPHAPQVELALSVENLPAPHAVHTACAPGDAA